MISAVLPAAAVAVESYGALPGAALLPEEEPLVAQAVPRRREEFTTTRSCARLALARLGLPPVPLLSGPAREPLWPEGVVGSLTHCAGYRAAAVARSRDLATIGIDAEPHEPLPDGVRERVAAGEELDELRRLDRRRAGQHWDRLLFSAKEAVYKAWYPLARRPLGFTDARVAFRPDAEASDGSFTVELLAPTPPPADLTVPALDGRYAVRGKLLVTAVALAAVDWATEPGKSERRRRAGDEGEP